MRWLVALLLTLLWTPAAHADDLRPGYLELDETSRGIWQMTWKAPIRGGLATAATPVVPKHCTPMREQQSLVDGALIRVSIVRCTRSLSNERVGLRGLDMLFTDALVRVAPLGRPVQAGRLTPQSPYFEVTARPQPMQVARTYFKLGVEHILFGFDHLLFVIALVVLLKGAWRVAATVTAFTAAHSLTLVATALGFVSVPRAPVESAIALSILFLAAEIIKVRPHELRISERFPWAVAFAFGLLHGFGFAGALAEIGMPEGEIPVALLTFNLGVEAGQLVVVLAAGALFGLARYCFDKQFRHFQQAAAYAIGGVAGFWFLERTIG